MPPRIKLIDDQLKELEAYTCTIIKDSQELIDCGKLSLERRSTDIKKLCDYNQCLRLGALAPPAPALRVAVPLHVSAVVICHMSM